MQHVRYACRRRHPKPVPTCFPVGSVKAISYHQVKSDTYMLIEKGEAIGIDKEGAEAPSLLMVG